jgi:xylulokinase
MSILGLDIGTTGAKGVVFDLDGRAIATAYREYNMLSPRPGHLELDPTEVLNAVAAVCQQVSAGTGSDPIRSVACSVLGEAITPVDAENRPLGNAIIGFDARGAAECEEFRRQISDVEVFRLTGHPINSFHTVFKLMHRRKHQADVYRRAARWLGFQELVAVSLGAEAAVDYSAAARTLLLDTNTLTWCDRIMGLTGMSAGMFARPVAPGTAIGTVGEAGHKRFGLPVGCVVAAGLHDQPAGILGAAVQPGESMYATGTVVCIGVLLTATPDPEVMCRCNLCCYPTYGRGRNVSLAWNFTGGSLLKWYRDTFGDREVAEARQRGIDPYDVILGDLPSGPADLFVLPHFTTTGTPWLDTRALGALFGLRLTTRRPEIVKAILEGIEYEIALNQSLLAEAGIEIRRYKAIGGAAKSPLWMQLKADVLGRPVVVLETTEAAALGVALLGARAAGLIESVSEAAGRFARTGRTFEPDAGRAAVYNERLSIYRDLYPATRAISHRIAALAAGRD